MLGENCTAESFDIWKGYPNMKAIILKSFGGPASLVPGEVQMPVPGKGEFLIKVHAAGVNPVDTKIRSGQFARFVPRLPAIIGRDICGTVVKAPGKNSRFKKGDRVLGMLDYDRGAYAEYAIGAEHELASAPKSLASNSAAAIPVAGLTAWQALFEHGRLQPGQRVLIHGSSGGVGHLAVQFAALHRAQVVGTCSGDDVDFVRELGAVMAIDYKNEEFEKGAGKVDLVVDLIGGKTRERSWTLLKPRGILVSTLPSPKPLGRTDVSGREVVVHADPGTLRHIADLAAMKLIKIELANVFPLEKANEAHQFLQDEHSRGKTVLSVMKD